MNEPTRQIHLDFHTSEHIPGIGSRFSREQWQAALRLGRVQLINIFAKGHHGWSYYPTQVGHVHPHLDFDLFGAQLAACHEMGVKAPVYFTSGWSVNDAEAHPEWCMRDSAGDILVTREDPAAKPTDPRPGFSWKFLCVGTAYHELMRAQTEEICRAYPVDGFWYDIYQAPRLCYCDACRSGMATEGYDTSCPEDVQAYRTLTIRRHADDLRELVRSFHPEASVYFNGLTALNRPENLEYRLYEVNTKNDMEDLPTTWGGYDKLPIRAKFYHKQGKPVVAMSGKFHTSWGEFGGFKHPDAIRAEAAAMVSFGVGCNFGDQLHPCGEMDLATYANIGKAFEYVEKIEDYGIGGLPVANLGLWLTGSLPGDEGTARMLMEEQLDFDVVRPGDDLGVFDAIVIPSARCLSAESAAALNRYAADGGCLVVLGEGALATDRDEFALDVGARYLGPGDYDVDYLVVGDALAEGLVRSPFLNYAPALKVRPNEEARVLATIREPYFSRTYATYCSHQNTPYQLDDAPHPGAVKNGNVLYFSHALDTMYYEHGARVHRQLFVNGLRALGFEPMLQVKLPSTGRVSLLHQAEQQRYVAHLLYAPPIQRGRCLVLEDLPSTRDVTMNVRLPMDVTRARLIPGGKLLDMQTRDGTLSVTIPEFSCHCAVVFDRA